MGSAPIEISHRVDAVDADVVNRPPTELARVEPDVAFLDLHGEDRVEQPGLSQAPSLHQLDGLEVGFLEVKPVSHHQLDPVLLADPDHGQTVLFGHRQRLLTEDVDSSSGCPFGVLPVQVVGKGDVDRVHHATLQALLELVVGKAGLDLISATEPFQLFRVIGDETSQLRVLCVGKGR